MKTGPRPKTIGRTVLLPKMLPKLKVSEHKPSLKQHTPTRKHNPKPQH